MECCYCHVDMDREPHRLHCFAAASVALLKRWGATVVPLEPTPLPVKAVRSCNRHDDCAAADVRAEAAWQEEQKKPRLERRELPRYADHCHDECCEDCFGR